MKLFIVLILAGTVYSQFFSNLPTKLQNLASNITEIVKSERDQLGATVKCVATISPDFMDQANQIQGLLKTDISDVITSIQTIFKDGFTVKKLLEFVGQKVSNNAVLGFLKTVASDTKTNVELLNKSCFEGKSVDEFLAGRTSRIVNSVIDLVTSTVKNIFS